MTSHTQGFLVVVVKTAPGSLNRGKIGKIQTNPKTFSKPLKYNFFSGWLGGGSDISDKPAFTPPGHIKRQQCKSKEALFGKIFDFF